MACDMTCGVPFLLTISTLWEQLTERRYPGPGESSPEDQEAAVSLIAMESPRGRHEAAAAAPTQFRLFPDLPKELRLLIWEAAARHKRYVVLDPPCNGLLACIKFCVDERKYNNPRFAGRRRRPLWTSPTPPPVLLSVSYEARQVALKVWQPAFAYGEFPAAVYMNFDQDDIVIRSHALINHKYFGLGGPIDLILRPWDEWVARTMLGTWLFTGDVEKIQRLVAFGDFMRGIRDYPEARGDLMTGLKSLTTIRIGDLKSVYDRKIYRRTTRSGKGAPLLSLDDIDFVKTADNSWLRPATTRSFADLQIIDFPGGTAAADESTCWTLGPENLGWHHIWSGDSRSCHLGPGKRCVRFSRWRYQTWNLTNIWYAI